jgi:hypothetical protein
LQTNRETIPGIARSAERGLRLQNPTSRNTGWLARGRQKKGAKFAPSLLLRGARGRKKEKGRVATLSQQKPGRLISVAILIAF